MKHLVKRLLWRSAGATGVVLVVFTLTFFLMHMAPGGPFAQAERLSAEAQASLEMRFGLHESLAVQFGQAVSNLVVGDMGLSLAFAPGRSVIEVLSSAAPPSMLVGGLGLLVALVFGVVGGILGGIRRGGIFDRVMSVVSLLAVSLSVIVVGGMLRRWGLGEGSFLRLGSVHGPRGYVLPVLTMGIAYGAIWFRLVRASVFRVVSGPMPGAVGARGVGRVRLMVGYIMPEALVPMLSYAGPTIAGMLTGSFVVERLFEIPGLSACFIEGALARDYPLVMGSIVLYTVVLVSLNLVFETLHDVLDPRLRVGAFGGGME